MEVLARVPAALNIILSCSRTQGIGSVSVPSPCRKIWLTLIKGGSGDNSISHQRAADRTSSTAR